MSCCLFAQREAMEELDLTMFLHGGATVTGFRILNPDQVRIRSARRDFLSWPDADPVMSVQRVQHMDVSLP